MSTENQNTPPPADTTNNTQPVAPAAPRANPFLEDVNVKGYSAINVQTQPDELVRPIPQPAQQQQTISSRQNPYADLSGDGGGSGGGGGNSGGVAGAGQASKPFNPAMNNLPPADMEQGAEHLTKIILDSYEGLKSMGNKMIVFSDKKFLKLQREGEIDLSVPIDMGGGTTVTAKEFIQEYNEQAKDTLSTSKEFKKEVTPILKRVLAKRGAAMTDEQMLVFLFGKDIAVSSVLIGQMRGTMAEMMDLLRENTAAYRGYHGTTPPPQKADPVPQAPPPQPQRNNTPPPPPPPAPVHTQKDSSSVSPFAENGQGRDRVISQRKKEDQWDKSLGKNGGKKSYKDAISEQKGAGVGRRKRIPIDEDEISDAIILNESSHKQKDPLDDID